MEPLTVTLLVLGSLIAAIGGIWLLVAAFGESIWWGLASLFVPFASLLFVILHWSKAKAAFCLGLLGTCVAIGGVVSSPSIRQGFTASMAAASGAAAEGQQKPTAQALSDQIQQKRDEIELGERQFREDNTALTQQFQALQAQRQALKPGDNSAVAAFNTEAATYQAKTAALRELRARVDAAQIELTALLDSRARQTAPPAPGANGSGKKVVMYTTSRCPACTAAKAYLARKGVTYEERDVERSADARTEFDRLGGRGVPLILVGDERMEGFSSQRLDQLL